MSTVTTPEPTITTYLTEADWLAARPKSIGASESPAVLGQGYANQNRWTVWESKVFPDRNPRQATKAMRLGRLLEPGIKAIFEDFTGYRCEPLTPWTVWTSPTHPYITATPDAIIINDRGLVPVELKRVSWRLLDDWEANGAPIKFQIQLQHQMYCLGAREGFLCALIGDDEVKIDRLDRNDMFIEQALLPQLEQFWALVETQTQPPVDGDAATYEVIKRTYPRATDSVTALPIDADLWKTEWLAAKHLIKEGEARKRAAEAKIMAAMGEHVEGLCPSGDCFRWAEVSRRAFEVKASTYRQLKLVERAV